MIPRLVIRVCGFDMSVNWAIWDGDLASKRDWFVDMVWLLIGTRSCDSIRVLRWAIVMLGLSICNRSIPSRLRILINILSWG